MEVSSVIIEKAVDLYTVVGHVRVLVNWNKLLEIAPKKLKFKYVHICALADVR
jgi:hypothetical protein